jgi:hypothetical protein
VGRGIELLDGSSCGRNSRSHTATGDYAAGGGIISGYMLMDTRRRSSARCWSCVGVVRISNDASAGACFG